MVERFWQRLPQEWQDRLKELGLSLHEIVTLASIIEKEAVVDSERPVIAGVFYNRLKINMPLQSDPTAVYDIPGFSGPVTAAHLTRQSPYNTYRIKGLPPGPICSPGAKSIHAALYPEKVPYLYFVSNNDGTHHFSVTSEEHRKAVSHYYELKKKALEDKGRPIGDPVETVPPEGRAGAGPHPQTMGLKPTSQVTFEIRRVELRKMSAVASIIFAAGRGTRMKGYAGNKTLLPLIPEKSRYRGLPSPYQGSPR